MIHTLKTHPPYFQQILDGQKTFEVRKNDRGFEPGHYVILDEWEPETKQYTGRKEVFQISFLLQGEFGLPSDVCVFSLIKIDDDPVTKPNTACTRLETGTPKSDSESNSAVSSG